MTSRLLTAATAMLVGTTIPTGSPQSAVLGSAAGCGGEGTVYVAYTVDTESRPPNSLGIYSDTLDLSDYRPVGLIDIKMNAYARGPYQDSYGHLPIFSWMLLADEYYCRSTTADCNAVFTQMEKYFDRAHALGDMFGWHYHSIDWYDGNNDGVSYWNQMLTFSGTPYTHGTDISLAEKMLAGMIIEKDFYPSVFRSGWVWEDNDFSYWLDNILPFDFSNVSPSVQPKYRLDSITNIYDWSRAPRGWAFYHPDSADYQQPGQLKRTIFRSSNAIADFTSAFANADSGQDQFIVTYTHSYNGGMGMDYSTALSDLQLTYPCVKVKFVTALDGARALLHESDTATPTVTVTAGDNRFTVDSDKPLFGYPYGALKSANGLLLRLKPVHALPDTVNGLYQWTFDLADQPQLARPALLAFGGTTPAGSTFVSAKYTIYDENPSDVDDATASLPDQFYISQNHPNPFNGGTQLEYHIPRPAQVVIAVYDLLGRKIRTIVNQAQSAGNHLANWDGVSEHGEPVASGVYFCRMDAAEFHGSRKMVCLK